VAKATEASNFIFRSDRDRKKKKKKKKEQEVHFYDSTLAVSTPLFCERTRLVLQCMARIREFNLSANRLRRHSDADC
jgi:hypothetical protein